MAMPMSIGELAHKSGVGIETIRFYEREGLLPEPNRRPSGYREYSADIARRLTFILQAKNLGFQLKEIGELLSLRVDEKRTCADVRKKATAKLHAIEEKIAHLENMRAALTKLSAACRGRGPASECPILDYLEQGVLHYEKQPK